MVEWIKSQLGKKDSAKLDFVRKGFMPEQLTEEFYRQALKADDRFTREFFAADLALRNAKVRYLNRALERPQDTDVMHIAEAPQPDRQDVIDAIFAGGNLLERERAIDNYLWNRIDEITVMMNFRLENILAIVAKLCIVERWLALDEKAGRELLGKLVGDIRGSYGDINYENFK